MIVLIIGHFLTSVKFRGNIKILRKRANLQLGSEFRDSRKTVGPSND